VKILATYPIINKETGEQKEHMDIAQQCRDVFVNELPICAEALEWS